MFRIRLKEPRHASAVGHRAAEMSPRFPSALNPRFPSALRAQTLLEKSRNDNTNPESIALAALPGRPLHCLDHSQHLSLNRNRENTGGRAASWSHGTGPGCLHHCAGLSDRLVCSCTGEEIAHLRLAGNRVQLRTAQLHR